MSTNMVNDLNFWILNEYKISIDKQMHIKNLLLLFTSVATNFADRIIISVLFAKIM